MREMQFVNAGDESGRASGREGVQRSVVADTVKTKECKQKYEKQTTECIERQKDK